MATETIEQLHSKLMTPPEKFSRENPEQFLYTHYSRKNRRRIYCYTHLRYDLWAILESDVAIRSFNERCPSIPIAVAGKVCEVRPSFVSCNVDGALSIHFIDRDSESEEGDTDADLVSTPHLQAATDWAREHDCSIIRWSVRSIRSNLIQLESLKTLLRFVSFPQRIVPPSTVAKVSSVLNQARSTTVGHVLASIPDEDEQWTMSAIALLILDKGCHSDIHKYRFHYSTELSAYHAFE